MAHRDTGEMIDATKKERLDLEVFLNKIPEKHVISSGREKRIGIMARNEKIVIKRK